MFEKIFVQVRDRGLEGSQLTLWKPKWGERPMIKGEVLETTFVCNCQKIRITIQTLPGRTIPVICRACQQVYEATGRDGEILFDADAEDGEPNSNHRKVLHLV
jgi:hypothetical protein